MRRVTLSRDFHLPWWNFFSGKSLLACILSCIWWGWYTRSQSISSRIRHVYGRHSIGNHFTTSGLCGMLLLGGGGWRLVILQFLAGLKGMTIEREVPAFTPRTLIPFCRDSFPNSSRVWLLMCCWLCILASTLCGKSFVLLRDVDNREWGKF